MDGLICIWEIATKSLLRVLTHSGKAVVAIALHPDDQHLAAAVTDEQIYVWEWQQSTVRRTLATSATLMALAFSPDGRFLLSVGDNRKIDLWDAQSGERVQRRQGHADKILAVAYNHQGDRFATGGEDGQIWLWDVATMQPLQVMQGHTDFVLALAFHPDDNSLDGTLEIRNIESGSLVHTIAIAPASDTAPTVAVVLACDIRGHRFACGTRDGQVLVYESAGAGKAYTLCYQVQVTEAPIWRLFFSPNGRQLVWICAKQEIHRLDPANGQVSPSIRTYPDRG